MKNKKGFTLIELLAIIVILAIIAVITVPIILNVIDNAKKGSIKDSAYGYKDAINKYYVSELYENLDLELDGTYTITDKGRLSNETGIHEIPFTGTTPTGGYLKYENNILTDGCITIDEYSVTVSNGEITTVEKGECKAPKIIKVINQSEKGKIQTGDELAIGSEHFYVVSSDEIETVLLAKYNLLVGSIYDSSGSKIRDIDETEDGYGLQNENAKGYADKTSERIGVVAFSTTNYWVGKVGDEFKYPGSYSGSDYPNVYDDNSNLYNYVQAYKTNLEKLGANIKDTKLLTYQDAINLGCANWSCTNVSEQNRFVYSTSYWFGSAYNNLLLWDVGIDGNMGDIRWSHEGVIGTNYSYPSYFGIRPVIVVNTSEIEI